MPFGSPSDPASTPINHFENAAVICESQGIRESLERSTPENKHWCPETESNRHVLLGTRDFKSRASASFAIRADSNPVKRIYQLIL